MMNYDAIAVGPLDLAQGVDFIIDHSPSQLSWISANIYGTDHTRLFPPYITVEKDGLSIAVIGITGKLRQNIRGITISHWEKELTDIVPSLSTSHDMILLLTTLPYKSVMAVTEKFPDIQIILGADLRKGNIRGLMKNSTIVAQTASQGKYLGQLAVNWRYQPWGVDLGTKQSAISNQLKSLIRQRAKLARYDSPGSTAYEKKKALLLKKQEQLTEELEELGKVAEDNPKTDQPSTYSIKLIPISPSIPEHPEIKMIVSAAENTSTGTRVR